MAGTRRLVRASALSFWIAAVVAACGSSATTPTPGPSASAAASGAAATGQATGTTSAALATPRMRDGVPGKDWYRVPLSDAAMAGGIMYRVAASGERLLAVGEDGYGFPQYWTSSTGTAWSAATSSEIGKGTAVSSTPSLESWVGRSDIQPIGVGGKLSLLDGGAGLWTEQSGGKVAGVDAKAAGLTVPDTSTIANLTASASDGTTAIAVTVVAPKASDAAKVGRERFWVASSKDGETWANAPMEADLFPGPTDLIYWPGAAAVSGANIVIAGTTSHFEFGARPDYTPKPLQVWLSSDGKDFTKVEAAGLQSDDIALPIAATMRGATAVVVGDTVKPGPSFTSRQAAVWTNAGGAWQRIPLPSDPGALSVAESVTYAASGYVAVGSQREADGIWATVWTSPDAKTWTMQKLAPRPGAGPHPDMRLRGVAAYGNGFVAVGDDGGLAAVWVSGRFAVADVDPVAARSVEATAMEGSTWQTTADASSLGVAQGNVTSVLKVQGGFLAVGKQYGSERPALWRSPDGRTWTRIPNDQIPPSPDIVQTRVNQWDYVSWSAAAVGDTVVVMSEGFHGWRSTDAGATWQALDAGKDGLGGRQLLFDKDSLYPETFRDLQGGTSFAAAGDACFCHSWSTGQRTAIVWTSADGLTWKLNEIDGPSKGGPAEEIVAIWNGQQGIQAFGTAIHPGSKVDDLVIWRSTDGGSWTRTATQPTGDAADMTAYDGVIVGGRMITGGEAAQGPHVWASDDGATWTGVPLTVEGKGVVKVMTTDGTTAVAIGAFQDAKYRTFLAGWTSTDGSTWKPFSTGAAGWIEAKPATALLTGGTLIVGGSSGGKAAFWIGPLK